MTGDSGGGPSSQDTGGTGGGSAGRPAAAGTGNAGRSSGGSAGAGTGSGGSTSGGSSAAGSGGKAGSGGAKSVGGTSGTGGMSGLGGVSNGGSAGAGAVSGSPSGECDTELLVNGDFEAGAVAFREESEWGGIVDIGSVIVPTDHEKLASAGFVAPPSGNYVAWLGGVPDDVRHWRIGLLQDVRIAAGAIRIVLRGRIQIQTKETTPEEYDIMYVQLEDAVDYWLFDPKPTLDSVRWTNLDATSGWADFETTISNASMLEAVRGRALSLRLESNTDNEFTTHFWFDSLSLVVECR
jgi:hypothetical protein